MPIGVKVGPFIAMSKGSSSEGPGCFGSIIILGLIVLAFFWPLLLVLGGSQKQNQQNEGWAWAAVVGYWVLIALALVAIRNYRRRHKPVPPVTVYFGKQDSIGWRCHHKHKTLAEAEACTAEYKLTDEYREKVAALPPAPRPQWPGGHAPDLSSQLTQLTELHASGSLSDDEFAAAKGRLLGTSG